MQSRNKRNAARCGLSGFSLNKAFILWLCVLSVAVNVAAYRTAYSETVKEAHTSSGKNQGKIMDESNSASGAGEADRIAERTNLYLQSGYVSFIPSQQVYDALKTGGNGYFVLSLQDSADFKKGHVPGAVNIPFNKLAKRGNLDRIPKNKKIIVVCYDGHLSNAATLFLNQIGYDATAMVMGLGAWNKDSAGMGTRKPFAGSLGYPISMESVTTESLFSNVPVVKSGKKSVEEMIIARTDEYLSSKRNLLVDAKDVYENTVKSDHPEYFLVSIQKADDYGKGHVPSAVNIPYTEIAKKENLLKLPKNKKIAVICYIGHSAAAVALFLNQLGYEAYDLQYGTLGWNEMTEGLGPQKQLMQAAIVSQGYATEGD